MPYDTGTATDVNDLLSKLRVFALAQGWSVDYNAARTDHTGQAVLLNKGGMRCGVFTRTNVSGQGSTTDPAPYMGPALYPGPYNSAQAAHAQTGISRFAYANNLPGPFVAYHLFAGVNRAGESYMHAVVEVTSGSFRHFGFGTINRAGAVTNGSYAYGNRWHWGSGTLNDTTSTQHEYPWDARSSTSNAFNNDSGLFSRGTIIRADGDTVSPRYAILSSTGSNLGAAEARGDGGYANGNQADGLRVGVSALTGRSVLLPLFVSVIRPGGLYSVLGAPPDIRFVDMTNLIPGASFALGADTWRAFPLIRKNGVSGQENSATLGYAYRVA